MWDGSSWSTFGTATDDYIYQIGVIGNALVVGGPFVFLGGKVSAHFGLWMPRVNISTLSFPANPGSRTLGDDLFGFYKPALFTASGTSVSFDGGLPVSILMDRAEEIHAKGVRVNGAFTISPDGVRFGGAGATLRVAFSEDDAAAFGAPVNEFRVARLVYPPDYPTGKDAFVEILSDEEAIPIRVENGRQIYAISISIDEISSTYGAVPYWAAAETHTRNWEEYE